MAKAADSDVMDERRLRALTERLSKEHGIADRRELQQTIHIAIVTYFTEPKASEWPPEPLTLDKITESAEDLIGLLSDENNRAVLAALDFEDGRHHLTFMEETPARIDRLVRDLSDLRFLAWDARTRFSRGKGRPANLPLRAALGILAADWEDLTGNQPTRLWHQGEPVSPFACFATTVIEHIDPDAVQHIATVVKKLLTKNRTNSKAF